MFSLLGKLRNEKLGLKEVTLESLKSVLIDNLQEFINLRRDDASAPVPIHSVTSNSHPLAIRPVRDRTLVWQ